MFLVLKCLRLSDDPVTLELKRGKLPEKKSLRNKIYIIFADPNIKDHVRRYLASNATQQDIDSPSITPTPSSPISNSSSGRGHRTSSSDSSACRKSRIPVNNSRIPQALSAPQSPQTIKPRYQSHIPTVNGLPQAGSTAIVQKKQNPRFEAYMMTGDLILNLSRTPQSSNLLPTQAKKSTMDSLRDSPARSLKRKNGIAPKAIYDSSPSESSSASVSELGPFENSENNHHNQQQQQHQSSKNDGNRKVSKLSRYTAGDSNADSQLDEEEEQLIMETTNKSSARDDERKTKYNLSNVVGCANNINTSSSSSSASSPTNTNSSHSSTNYDGGGGGALTYKNNINNHIKGEQVDYDCNPATTTTSQQQNVVKNQKYTVLHNEEMYVKQQQQQFSNLNVKKELTPSASMSSTTTSSASTTINRSETLNTPTVDASHSVPTSPTSFSTPLLEATKRRENAACSVPTSPECGLQPETMVVRRNSTNVQNQQNGVPSSSSSARNNNQQNVGGFRTSRSEDHLQHSQREGMMGNNAIPIDIDEDMNSSLNTLLDTRNDSEDSVRNENHYKDKLILITINRLFVISEFQS